MNALFKTKTTFRSKFSALGALLLVLNFGVAWGQTDRGTINMVNNTGGTTEFTCNEFYTLQFTDAGGRGQTNKTYKFTNSNGGIRVDAFTFTAIRYNNNNDYLEIKINGTTSNDRIYGNTTNNNGWTRCSNGSSYRYRTYNVSQIEVSPDATTGVATIEFIFHDGFIDPNNNIGGSCTHANFKAKVIATNKCCPGTPTLASPVDGAVYAEGTSSITLEWNDVDYDNGYTIKVTDGDGNAISNAGVGTTSLQYPLDLTGFREGKYTWTVTPTTDVQECTPQSASRTFYVIGCPTLTSPADNATISGDLELKWDLVPGISQYKVTITNSTTSETAITRNVSATSLTLGCSDLANGTYTWKVVPLVNGNEVSGLSCTTTRTFDKKTTLSCPTNLQPANGTVLERRSLSWDPVPCANKYTVYVAPTSVGIGNLTTSTDNRIYKMEVTTTELQLPIMAQGDYYWTVIPETSSGSKATGCNINSFSIRYASSEDHDISPSTQGKDFYFSLMENGYYNFAMCGGGGFWGGGSTIHKYTAIIAPKEDATVTFYYYAAPSGNNTRTFTVTGGQTDTVNLPEDWVYHPNPGENLDRTVHVTSSADISLYIANEACNSFDASIVLPTSALGTDYMIQTYKNGEHNNTQFATLTSANPCFMVIATEDDTPVRITVPTGIEISELRPAPNTADIGTDAAGLKYYDVMLNEGQSYFVRTHYVNNNTTTRELDLSGVRISVAPRNDNPEDSCKTIAVFNGNTLTRIPAVVENNFDHIFEQAYPINNWGTKFAVTSSDGYVYVSGNDNQPDVDYIRITASEANTEISIYQTDNNGNITTTTRTITTAGGSYDFDLPRSNGSCYIETTKPVACYLYQRSGYNTDAIGDPSMVWIAPIERGIEKITFSTFEATEIYDHWVNIVIPADALDIRTSGRNESKTVWLGDIDITREFQTDETLNYVQGSNNKYAYARIKIDHGTYTVASNCGAKMVLHVYGLGNVRGYAYNAGSAAVPYKSAFSIGDGEREFDMTALPADYHFCSGQKYVFRVSSNGNMDSVIFDFQNGERRKKVITPENDTIHHTITQGGDYRIISYVFSTVYNHDLCQKEIVVDTVEDHTYIFLSETETVNDSVCYGVPYTYTRQIWTHNENDSLVLSTFTHDFNTAYTGSQTLHIEHARSQYGCDIDLTINLKVFGEMKPGTIGSEEVKCQEGSDGSANLSVTMLTNSASASGGPSDAHYEWQKRRITSIAGTDTTWADTDWITLPNQTNPTYTVTEPAAYRRVYMSATCGTVYSNLIYVSQAGSFVPGTHIDEVVRVCNYETVNRTIGGELSESSIQQDGGGYYVVVSTNGTQETIRLVIRWEKSEGTQDNWQTISGATSYNYSINQTFSISTYFRRIIDLAVTDCNLNLSMGVFAVEVKPDYTITMETLSGCYNNNNASALLTISGGSGSFGVTYKLQNSSDSRSAVLEGGKYKCSPLNQGVNYIYTVVDNTYGCTKTGTINIANPTPLSVATATPTSACQGSPINLPIPAISGGDMPYSVTITSTGLGIVEARPIQVEVNTNDATTISYNVPMDVSAESKTLGYVIRDVNNCRVASDQTVVTIEKVPVFNLSNTDLTSCEAAKVDATITATVTNATGSPKYDYQINYGSFNADNKTSATHTFGAATAGDGLPQGVYNITVIDENTNNKCSATKEYEIKSNFVPTIVLVVPELTMIATNQYSGCPNKVITVSVSAINNTAIGSIAKNTYQYSIDGSAYRDEYSFQAETSNKCGSQTISVYVKEVSTGCIFKQDLSIIIEDGIIPTIDASLTNMDVTTYFCPTYTVPEVEDIKNNIKAYISDNCASDDDLSVSVTPNTGTFNVADGAQTVTITVKDLCGNTATKQITITPKPWPNFKINGIATNGTDNDCYCHGDNITLTAVLEDGTDISYEGASYQWYKVTTDNNGDEVSTSITNDGRYSGADTKELKISSAISTDDDPTNGDDGVYKLVITDITDPKGCTKEATITICVHPDIKFNLE